MTEELQREIGRHDAQIEGLQNDMAEVKADVKAIREMMAEARGGWKVMMMVAGAAGAVSAGLTWIATHIRWP